MGLHLKPSEIYYSQDSIHNKFRRRSAHSNTLIGQTLDAICEGRTSIENIPTITVTKEDGKWFTHDNRRLWIFRHLERLGKCKKVKVMEDGPLPSRKSTYVNGGKEIEVRGDPGGTWRLKPSAVEEVSISPLLSPKQEASETDLQSEGSSGDSDGPINHLDTAIPFAGLQTATLLVSTDEPKESTNKGKESSAACTTQTRETHTEMEYPADEQATFDSEIQDELNYVSRGQAVEHAEMPGLYKASPQCSLSMNNTTTPLQEISRSTTALKRTHEGFIKYNQ